MKIDVFTAFSGYDSQCLALSRLCDAFPGFSYDLVGWSEIDRYAVTAHNALFPRYASRNFGDIMRIQWRHVPDFDLLTYSFPCQDISSAGRQRGFAQGSGTRSSCLWACADAVMAKHPKFLLMENVKALTQRKFAADFSKWRDWLREQGYASYFQVLNARDYGVPQNRERVFMVSVRGEHQHFFFPGKMALERRLGSILENNVDESYYLKPQQVERIVRHCGYATCIKELTACAVRGRGENNAQQLEIGGNVANTITTVQKDSMVAEPMASISPLSRKLEFKGAQSIRPIAPALRASDYKCPHVVYQSGFRIRRLTPRECFRLMDVSDSDIDKMQDAGLSKTQQYKLAGNSIVVSCLYQIFRKMFIDHSNEQSGDTQLLLF